MPVTMHPDERHTDVPLVRRLLAGQFPEWATLRIEPVPSAGTDNGLYRLGDEMVVRLPRVHWAVAAVDREHEWLPHLAPHLPVAIPSPLARGEPAEGYPWPWSVYRWLDGENPTAAGIADPASLATDLAQFVRALRRIDPAGGPPAPRGMSLAMQDREARAALDDLQGMLDVDFASAIWDAALRAHTWSGAPVWIHGDLGPGNLLLEDGRLAAVIDFGCVGLGDPACDLIVAWNLLPADAREIFRAELGADDATWERGRSWAFSIALIQLPYYKDTNPALAANARHVIDEVFAG